jgi:hypothetical protein
MDQLDTILRYTLQYEKKKSLSRLTAVRDVLETECKRHTSDTPLIILKTKLAVAQCFVHYSILRAEILGKGLYRKLLTQYHSTKLCDILDANHKENLHEERRNMILSYSHGYSKEDHARMIKLMEWIKANVLQLNEENLFTLEKDLPTKIFDLKLEIGEKATRGRKRTPGERGHLTDSESEPDDSDDDRRALKDSLRTQLTHMAPSRATFGRFELPPGKREEEYPPGYFDPFVDCVDCPYNMTFVQFFDNNLREGIEPFSGDTSRLGVAYPVFFEKFRTKVHLKREDKVSVDMKFKIFASLLKDNSPAKKKLRLYNNWADTAGAYDECMRRFWKLYGMDREALLQQAKSNLGSIHPTSNSEDDTLDFVYQCTEYFQTLVQNGMKSSSAAKKVCGHIITEIDPTLRMQYFNNKGIKYDDMHRFYLDGPKKILLNFPSDLEAVFNCRKAKKRKEEDSDDDDVSFNAKLTHSLINPNSSYSKPKAQYSRAQGQGEPSSFKSNKFQPKGERTRQYAHPHTDEGKTNFRPIKCFFCPGEHRPWDCPLSIPERIKVALGRSKCLNCFKPGCKGTKLCSEPSKCRFCPDTPKHSSWICQRATEGYKELQREERPPPSAGPEAKTLTRPQGHYSAMDAATIAASIAALKNSQDTLLAALATKTEDTQKEPSENSGKAPTS